MQWNLSQTLIGWPLQQGFVFFFFFATLFQEYLAGRMDCIGQVFWEWFGVNISLYATYNGQLIFN